MRSSCEASATKRRSWAALRSRVRYAVSTWWSIEFRASRSCSTSWVGWQLEGTRRVRSPSAIADEVSTMSSSGRIRRRTLNSVRQASSASSRVPTARSSRRAFAMPVVQGVRGGGHQDVRAVGQPGRRHPVGGAVHGEVVRVGRGERAGVPDGVREPPLRLGRLDAEEGHRLALAVDGGEDRVRRGPVGAGSGTSRSRTKPSTLSESIWRRVSCELPSESRVRQLGVDLAEQVVPHRPSG